MEWTTTQPFVEIWMDLENIIVSEVSRTEKDKYITYITYMQNVKNNANRSIYKTETDSQTQKTNLWLPKGERGKGINLECGINGLKLPYTKQISNKDLLYTTEKYIKHLIITFNEK